MSYWEESPPALFCVKVSAHWDSQCLRFPHSFNHPGVPRVLSWALLHHDGHFTIYDLPRSLHCKDGKIQHGPSVSLFSGEGGYHKPSMSGPIILKKLGHNNPAVPPDLWGMLTLPCSYPDYRKFSTTCLESLGQELHHFFASFFLCPCLCQADGPQ